MKNLCTLIKQIMLVIHNLRTSALLMQVRDSKINHLLLPQEKDNVSRSPGDYLYIVVGQLDDQSVACLQQVA